MLHIHNCINTAVKYRYDIFPIHTDGAASAAEERYVKCMQAAIEIYVHEKSIRNCYNKKKKYTLILLYMRS